MNTQDTVETRELADSELDGVSGGIWGLVARLAIGVGMAIIEGQQHNGSGSGKLGEGLHK